MGKMGKKACKGAWLEPWQELYYGKEHRIGILLVLWGLRKDSLGRQIVPHQTYGNSGM